MEQNSTLDLNMSATLEKLQNFGYRGNILSYIKLQLENGRIPTELDLKENCGTDFWSSRNIVAFLKNPKEIEPLIWE